MLARLGALPRHERHDRAAEAGAHHPSTETALDGVGRSDRRVERGRAHLMKIAQRSMARRHEGAQAGEVGAAHGVPGFDCAAALPHHVQQAAPDRRLEPGRINGRIGQLLAGCHAHHCEAPLGLLAPAPVFRAANVVVRPGVASRQHRVGPRPRNRFPATGGAVEQQRTTIGRVDDGALIERTARNTENIALGSECHRCKIARRRCEPQQTKDGSGGGNHQRGR